MLGKAKESSGRFAGASNDGSRLFNKALDLLESSAPESDHELLELVRKAKREADKDSAESSKKATPGRGHVEISDLPAYGHRTIFVPTPGQVGVQATTSTEGAAANLGNPVLGSTSPSLGRTQARVGHTGRSGSARVRAEKPKRKLAR